MARHNHYRDTSFNRGKMITMYYFPPGMKDDVIEAAKRALAKGVIRIVADAKTRCPVDTGTLKASIKAESNDDESIFYVSANAYKLTQNPNSPTGRFYYGPIVEFSPKINKPFMYPAIDAHKLEIRENIREAVLRTTSGYGFGRSAA